tara:strand:+ start:2553 stop:3041 length:489 start_codon:yes stop_codon:yes gene_type:complete
MALFMVATLLVASTIGVSAAQRPRLGLGNALKTSAGYLFNAGGTMTVQAEKADFMHAIRHLLHNNRIDARTLRPGAQVTVYCVTGRSERLKTVMVFEQTRRGLCLKELNRSGNQIFANGRRKVSSARAATELSYAHNIELQSTGEWIEIRQAPTQPRFSRIG